MLSYANCGFFAFRILRALGEQVMYRPSSGKAERPALAAQPAGDEGTEDDADQTRV
ncbi:hypothetical protein [Citricoccus sp. NR2]|uniref:hypothetical protein n=1 Tax=Citricoccus sp. NR2 TaxID=3004095 RepID=UPI0022DE24B2|nr:hypothetical protein [Citricoccus sp. NR2]WBL20429.1 hypothetical protein O1A05_07055 [Citricoccus sp. NR2]